ncbi:PSAP [Anthophora retusa]
MKILIALCAILAVCTARVVINAEGPANFHLLGEQECTWGPSYWCENIKTASGCNATKHCIKTVWQDMKVPEDNDNVCNICKDMVQQARDQLESNQTQEDLKAVFEGSCKLIHIKPIVQECITIVNQFIPDLIETLASEMNPSVVCSVSGLCNSAHIDKLIEYDQSELKVKDLKSYSLEKDELEPDECSKCYTIATHMEHKLHNTPRDKMLHQMLNLCAELSTFTDACSAIILTHFDTIYTHLQENFNAETICHLSGQCSDKFHKHEDADKTLKVEIRPLSSVGMVDVNDDLPCKLCEQLVEHLRDLLVANTTEAEFEQVLQGLCKQTKSFSAECIAIVDEYYPQIYQYLTKGLNSEFACQMSGLCPSPDKSIQTQPIWPLLPKNAAEKGMQIFQGANKDLENNNDEQLSKSEVEAMQLPIERLVPFPMSEGLLDVKGKETCALCENVLHYIQNVITNPTTESEVKEALGKVCNNLPGSLKGQCTEFVDVYGDAIVAILAEEIDPSQVCPMLRLCPTAKMMELWQSIPAKYMLEEKKKPSCPLCLLAVSQIYNVIKNNKTEANIEHALDKLCIHLPKSLAEECTDLVKGYSKELVELLLADLTPQEVCVFMELCEDEKYSDKKSEFITDKDGEILTNEIPNAPLSPEITKHTKENTACAICEFVMQVIDEQLDNEKEKDKIESVVHGVCNHLPETVSGKCNSFVNKYGDAIIELITKDVSPKQLCTLLALCTNSPQELEETSEILNIQLSSEISPDTESIECSLCEFAVHFIEKELGSERGKNKVESVVHGVCKHLPKTVSRKCNKLVDKHAATVVDLIIKNVSTKLLCTTIGLCSNYLQEIEETSKILNIQLSSEISPDTESIECSLCEFAVHFIEKELGSERGKNKVESVVHGVCKHLPKTVSRKCNKLVDKHAATVVDLIIKNVSTKLLCTTIGLCSNYRQELEVANEISIAKISEVTNDAKCAVCELAMYIIDKELDGEKGKHKVEGAVHGVCNHLPKSLSQTCNNFVNEYGDAAIDAIIRKSPKEVCNAIKVCSTYVQEVKASVKQCAVCKSIMSTIDDLLDKDDVDNSIKHVVSKVCKYLPESVQKQCITIINSYGQSIINLVKRRENIHKICSKVSLCAPEDYSTVSLESSRNKRSYEKIRIKQCTWGPVYWCSSNEAAHECKAVDHCRTHIWKADFAPPKQLSLSDTEPNETNL